MEPAIERFIEPGLQSRNRVGRKRIAAQPCIRKVVELESHPAIQALIIERITPTDEELSSDQKLDAWLLTNVGTSHHISCTCKMGPASDPMAVVDQYGKVHGLQNLRVVDASIMPDCIRANTNATTIMIAEKIADFVIEGK